MTPEELHNVIAQGESDQLEFKASLQWDRVEHRGNKELRIPVAKTVAAFLNTRGGRLLIGVTDGGDIVGIEDDLQTLSAKDWDSFERTLRQSLAKFLGPEVSPSVA